MNEHPRKFDATATIACIGTLCFWALGPNFIRYLRDYVDPWTQNVLRYSVACLFWLPFLALRIRAKRFDKSIWRRALLPAGANVCMQSLWAGAFYYIEPGFMVLLSKTSIIWIAGFSLIFFAEERVLIRSKRFWSGLGLCVVGVLGVVYFKEDLAAQQTVTGIMIGLAAALMWGVYTITIRMAFRNVDSRVGFSVISIYTVLGLGAAALAFGRLEDCAKLAAPQWGVIVISAILCIALAHVLYYTAIRRIGATIPALVILAQPVGVLAISHFAFHESITPPQIIFGLTLLIGAALAIWAQQHLLEK